MQIRAEDDARWGETSTSAGLGRKAAFTERDELRIAASEEAAFQDPTVSQPGPFKLLSDSFSEAFTRPSVLSLSPESGQCLVAVVSSARGHLQQQALSFSQRLFALEQHSSRQTKVIDELVRKTAGTARLRQTAARAETRRPISAFEAGFLHSAITTCGVPMSLSKKVATFTEYQKKGMGKKKKEVLKAAKLQYDAVFVGREGALEALRCFI